MKYTSILEKINCLSQLINSSIIYPIAIIIFLILLLLIIIKKIKPKTGIILMIIDYLGLLAITIANNTKPLGKIFDNISTNFFTNIYFPSTYTYLFILTIVNIVTLKGILNKDEEKAYKITNGICFFINQFLFVLILNIISTNKIDIFVKKSLFSNTNLIILLEMSINVFLIWLLSRSIIYTTNKIAESINIKKIEKDNKVLLNNTLVVEDIKEEKTEDKKEEYIYATNNEINDSFTLNDLIFETPTNNNNDILLDKLLNNGLPIIKEEEIEEEKKQYTLNDYKIFNKILKEIRETNNSNTISITKELDDKLSNKYTEEEYKLFKIMLKNYSN